MRAVWSFWTKPFITHHREVWLSERHHLLSWILSVASVSAHYKETALVTDDAGADLLVDRLGLQFGEVSTTLNSLDGADSGWWVLGKLWAYRQQTKPFVHLDSDVYLWRRLSPELEQAAVFGQNPEWFPSNDGWYRPEFFDGVVRSVGGWLPEEWRWYIAQKKNEAICCGILGGNDVRFISRYADAAIMMIDHPANQAAWASIGNVIGDNILVEQYMLAACVEFYREQLRHPGVAYVFESTNEAFDESAAARVGYTHLIGGAKANRAIASRLERRVRRDFPEFHARAACIAEAIEERSAT
jgi:hypothetical protein